MRASWPLPPLTLSRRAGIGQHIRNLAEEAGVGSTRTIAKSLDRLRTEHRLIRRDRSRAEVWRASATDQPQQRQRKGKHSTTPAAGERGGGQWAAGPYICGGFARTDGKIHLIETPPIESGAKEDRPYGAPGNLALRRSRCPANPGRTHFLSSAVNFTSSRAGVRLQAGGLEPASPPPERAPLWSGQRQKGAPR